MEHNNRIYRAIEIREEIEKATQELPANSLELSCRLYKLMNEMCDLYEIPNLLKHPEEE